MPRVKRGVTARAKHKKVFEFTKGHRGRRKNVYRVASVREHGLTYAKFIDGLKKANIEINRKILSEIAFHEPAAFKSIVEKAKANLAN